MVDEFHKRRFDGLRWRVVYDRYDGVAAFAVDELVKEVQACQPYVLPVLSCEQARAAACAETEHEVLVGLAGRHPGLSRLTDAGLLDVPDDPQGYAVFVGPHPQREGCRMIAVAGRSEAGLLHGVMDVNARVFGEHLHTEPQTAARLREDFDRLPDLRLRETPAVRRRGIWTWGYVMYDYARYLDNMARLRMNTLVAWFDHPPVNAVEVIDYAHRRGIDVIAGFHWGWGLTGLELDRPADRRQITEMVLRHYDEHYARLNVDGLYFQTLTETSQTRTGGMSVAAAARELVNETAAVLLDRRPGMPIYFGLHATSIASDAHELAGLDDRVEIMWEDAGGIPYQYIPTLDPAQDDGRQLWGERWAVRQQAGQTIEQCTVEYSRQLAEVRPGHEFAMVPKGWCWIRWDTDFEHHGPMVMGHRRRAWITDRLRERQPRWDQSNALWIRHLGLAAAFYRRLLEGGRPMTVAALIEDGLLEETIQPGVAILGQTLWNPHRPDADILQAAMSRYYKD